MFTHSVAIWLLCFATLDVHRCPVVELQHTELHAHTHTHRDPCILAKLYSHTRTTIENSVTVLWYSYLSPPQAVLSDDGVGVWLGEADPPEEPLTLQVSVPPHQLRLEKLLPHTPYHIRVSCTSSQGPSPWTHWLPVETTEGGKKVFGGRYHWALLSLVPP